MLGVTEFLKNLVIMAWLTAAGTTYTGEAQKALSLEAPKVLPEANVYLWVQNGFPEGLAQSLANDLSQRLKIKIAVVPGYRLKKSFYNSFRNQYAADKVYDQAENRYGRQIEQTKTIMIVLVHKDIYMTSQSARYVFGTYNAQSRVSVLSITRMDQSSYGYPANNPLLYQRISKYIKRYIGIQYFKLPPSDNKNSVLYQPIRGVEDLDMIGEEY